MKILFPFVILVLGSLMTNAQVDSAQFSNKLNALKSDIENLKSTAYQQSQSQQAIVDSITELHQEQQHKVDQLLDQLSQNQEKLESISMALSKINGETTHITRNQQQNFLINYILHGFSLVLVLFLIIYVLVQRQRSLDFLLTRANKLAGQNNEILERTEELISIKKSLKEVIENQKKTNKALKKKKK